MTIKYLVAGPGGAFISFITFMLLGFGLLPAIGLSWLAGCIVIAATIIFEVYSAESVDKTAVGAEVVGG